MVDVAEVHGLAGHPQGGRVTGVRRRRGLGSRELPQQVVIAGHGGGAGLPGQGGGAGLPGQGGGLRLPCAPLPRQGVESVAAPLDQQVDDGGEEGGMGGEAAVVRRRPVDVADALQVAGAPGDDAIAGRGAEHHEAPLS